MDIDEEKKQRATAKGWISERRKAYDEEVARRDPAAAEAVQGYRKRVQEAEANGVTRRSEYQAASEYARTHGDISARYERDKYGNVSTIYSWTGKTADGREGSTDLVTVQGRHSVYDYNNRYDKLNVISSNVDPKSEGFNNTMKFLFGKGSVYAMTDQEKRGFKAVNETRKDLVASGWTPKGGWGESAGGKLTDAELSSQARGVRPASGAGSSSGAGSQTVFSRDDAWLGGKKVEELGNRERLLYNLGVSKDEWDSADRAGKKAILEKQIYGDGMGTERFEEARGHVANFYGRRASEKWGKALDADDSALTRRGRLEYERTEGVKRLFGDKVSDYNRYTLEDLYGKTKISDGKSLNDRILSARDDYDKAVAEARRADRKADLWRNDTAQLWANRQKMKEFAKIRRDRKEDVYG